MVVGVTLPLVFLAALIGIGCLTATALTSATDRSQIAALHSALRDEISEKNQLIAALQKEIAAKDRLIDALGGGRKYAAPDSFGIPAEQLGGGNGR